jgi:hypothetical protein
MLISRRSVLGSIGALASSLVASPLLAQVPPTTGEVYADPVAAEKWLSILMNKSQATNTPLLLGRFADRMYFLSKQISWSPEPGQNGYKKVQVPIGFVTDFASIPRVFWTVLPPDGTYTYAAIIHDYLYWDQSVSKKDADMIMKFVMEEFKVDAASAATIYRAVDLMGQSAWDKNRSLKESGERRILKKFPDDPKITWPTWKVRPGAV